jgi:hypothetical protein
MIKWIRGLSVVEIAISAIIFLVSDMFWYYGFGWISFPILLGTVFSSVFLLALVTVVGWHQLSSKMDEWGMENRIRLISQEFVTELTNVNKHEVEKLSQILGIRQLETATGSWHKRGF